MFMGVVLLVFDGRRISKEVVHATMEIWLIISNGYSFYR